jgi:hypothetical protein
MRSFLVFLIFAGLGCLYYWQKHNETPPAAVKTVGSQTTLQAKADAPPPRPVSEHNWMKRSLDRAHDVGTNAAAQTRQSQDP